MIIDKLITEWINEFNIHNKEKTEILTETFHVVLKHVKEHEPIEQHEDTIQNIKCSFKRIAEEL